MTNVIAILIIALMAVLAFFLYRTLFIRGLRRVVAIFRATEALDARRAKTLEELGLKPPAYVRRMFKPRDYRQSAAELLHRQGVIKMAEGGRFYLSESALEQSPLKKYLSTD